LTAGMLLDELSPKFAEAQQVPPHDSRLATETLEYDSPQGSGTMKGYLARPASAKGKKLPGILVIHENRGLNPHIEDIARRLALDNFMAFAPDALTPLGGYPGTEDEARELFQKLDQTKSREDFVTGANVLRKRSDCTGKIGAVGFCYGGGMVNFLATRMPELKAGVAFYGNQPPAADVPKIKAPLLLHYAETDERINAGWPAYEAALKENKKKYEAFFYPGTQHGFNNDTTPRFDAAAAKLAWSRTVDFFKKNVA
jgi:carboxymethylenebutenolidase